LSAVLVILGMACVARVCVDTRCVTTERTAKPVVGGLEISPLRRSQLSLRLWGVSAIFRHTDVRPYLLIWFDPTTM
jgi:hypothetical protein